jgi:RHS repeat-associated protein
VFDVATGNMVFAFDSTGAMTDRFLWGPATNQILADEQFAPTTAGEMPTSPGNTLWALANNQGSVEDVVDSSGTLQNHAAFDPFGNAIPSLSSSAVDFLFGQYGEFSDPATGQVFAQNRVYDPAINRWDRPDPTGLLFGPNPYEYVGNSPTNFIDPSGLAPPALTSRDVQVMAAMFAAQDYLASTEHDPPLTPLAEAGLLMMGIDPNPPAQRQNQGDNAAVPLPPAPDFTGRIHDPIPESVPKEWGRQTCEEALDNVGKSLDQRAKEIADHGGPDAGHNQKYSEEQRWKKQLEDRLRQLQSAVVAVGTVTVITWGLWELTKWGAAALAAPETGGLSLAAAAATP